MSTVLIRLVSITIELRPSIVHDSYDTRGRHRAHQWQSPYGFYFSVGSIGLCCMYIRELGAQEMNLPSFHTQPFLYSSTNIEIQPTRAVNHCFCCVRLENDELRGTE